MKGKNNLFYLLVILFLTLTVNTVYTQVGKTDSSTLITNSIIVDSATKTTPKKHIPRIATIRSAILPGLGQIYNREYWKLPLVYGALAIPTYTFFYNNYYYQMIKYAYTVRYNQQVNGGTAGVANIDPQVAGLDVNSLLNYRNQFRKDRDYSIMWFFIVWGLNVVDATVFANLKDFSVSDNLAMRVEPKLMPVSTFAFGPGLGFTLSVKHPSNKKFEIK